MNRTCGSCVFAAGLGIEVDPSYVPQFGALDCRRRAPERRGGGDHRQDQPAWPLVAPTDWCGDYARRPGIPYTLKSPAAHEESTA